MSETSDPHDTIPHPCLLYVVIAKLTVAVYIYACNKDGVALPLWWNTKLRHKNNKAKAQR